MGGSVAWSNNGVGTSQSPLIGVTTDNTLEITGIKFLGKMTGSGTSSVFAGVGISFYISNVGNDRKLITIRNCIFNNLQMAIEESSGYNLRFSILNNTIHQVRIALYLQSTYLYQVSNCYFDGGSSAICVVADNYGSSSGLGEYINNMFENIGVISLYTGTVSNNLFYSCSDRYGYLIYISNLGTVSGNAFYSCSSMGNFIYCSSRGTVSSNACYSCSSSSSFIYMSSSGVISSNAFWSCQASGNFLYNGYSSSVSNNYFESCSSGVGQTFLLGYRGSITGNSFYSCYMNGTGLRLIEVNYATVANNEFNSIPSGQTIIFLNYSSAVGNICDGSSSAYAMIDDNNTPCVITSNNFNGISSSGSTIRVSNTRTINSNNLI
jgi:hypothetical protein